MANSGFMHAILLKVGLSSRFSKFDEQKITPDIVGSLNRHEMLELGVTNTSDMMSLRLECNRYGNTCRPTREPKTAGAPKYSIPGDVLENLLEDGFSISDVAALLSVSERIIYRKMQEYGLSKIQFSDIDSDELDNVLKAIDEFPFCGEKMLRQILFQKNVKIQRSRLRDILHRLDPKGIEARSTGRLQKKVYNVQGPNHLWYVDTNHKLVRWNFIIAAGIDGFSRLVVFLKCIDNNKADTLLRCFVESVQQYGLPLRVRADKGMENCKIADFMIENRGLNRGSMILGKSVHNQRVERLWRDVFDGVLCFYYRLFNFLEDEGLLDPLNELHLLALHYVFLPKINEKLKIWRGAWDRHKLRTTKESPICLWPAGQLNRPTGIDIVVPTTDLDNYGVEGQFTDD
ncbi:hypothetical protein ScPMuIL_006801 [Solemya velum]